MSLVPFLLNDPFSDSWNVLPRSLFDQNFGMGVLNDDLHLPRHSLMYYRPWRHLTPRESGTSNVQYDKDGFKVNLDVKQFKPEEITVKTVGNSVVIEGKHEERQDEHGYISRHFQRRYTLPKDVDPSTVISKLSSDGILSIEGPRKALPESEQKERVLPLLHTNAPAVKDKKEDAKMVH